MSSEMRRVPDWDRLMEVGHGPRIMAVVNVSPESFFGGSVSEGEAAVARAAQAAEAGGAAMLDIGAMSTAPYKQTYISAEEEKARLVGAIVAARSATLLPISADTQRADVAAAALDAGAVVINDVSGLRGDPAMADVCADAAAGVILMANDDPAFAEEATPMAFVERRLEEALARARAAGIFPENIMLDPGFGFFRHRAVSWSDFDLAILRGLGSLRSRFHRPLLLGASRKSFFREVLGHAAPEDRLAGSLAVAGWAALQGVEWLRVHDVAETRDVLAMMALLAGGAKRGAAGGG